MVNWCCPKVCMHFMPPLQNSGYVPVKVGAFFLKRILECRTFYHIRSLYHKGWGLCVCVCVCVCFPTGLHSDRISHWLQIFSWHEDLVSGLSGSPHSSGATVTAVSVPVAWTWVTWRQMTWRCWVPGPHLLLHSDHSPTSQLSANRDKDRVRGTKLWPSQKMWLHI